MASVHNKRSPRLAFSTAVALTMLAGAGCGGEDGPEYAQVSGTVMLDSQPMASGMITFVPVEGTPGPSSSSNIDENGNYQLRGPGGKGAIVGKYKILIRCPDTQVSAPPGENVSPFADAPPCNVPEKYTRESSTPLEKEVTSGTNTIPIELSST